MLALPAELTQPQATAALRALTAAAGAERQVHIDASALQRFDSSALAVLLECRRQALAAGKPFSVSGVPAKLASLAAVYGIDGLLAAS